MTTRRELIFALGLGVFRKTAKLLGLSIPTDLLLRADELVDPA